jgi:hypothetical protein
MKDGLSTSEARKRIAIYGYDELPSDQSKNICK